MKINKVYVAYFSPGGTTKTVATAVADSFNDYAMETIDLTDYEVRQNRYDFHENDLLILAAPAYAGRAPKPVIDAICSQFHAVNTPVVIIATYGNRTVDDTLMELKKTVFEKGFIICGAATFSCQHTFLSELGFGRPDEADLADCKAFGDKLRNRLRLAVTYNFNNIEVPGHYPYEKPPMGQFPFVVETSEFCIYCMLCAGVCPMNAISESNPFSIQHDICVRCGSCIRICPAQAKEFTKEPFQALQNKLRPAIEPRKDNWFCVG